MDSTRLHRFLADGGWQRPFQHSTLQHGAAYVREQSISSLNHATLDPQTESLTGAVRGSRLQPYLCALELRMQRSGIQIRSQCSCGEDSPCKHAAAILIVAGLSPPEAWPGAEAYRPAGKAKEPNRTRHVSRLHIETSPVPVLVMRAVAAQAASHATYACARLEFDYGGYRLARENGADPAILSRDDGDVEIHRDPTSEAIARERIEETGFINADVFMLDRHAHQAQVDNRDFLLRPNKRKPPLSPDECDSLIAPLEQDGFAVEYEAGFPRHELVEVADWHATLSRSGNAWFDVSLGVDIDGKRVDILPVFRQLLDDPGFALTPRADESNLATRRIRLDAEHSVEMSISRLRELVSPLLEWLQTSSDDGGMRVHVSQAHALQEIVTEGELAWHGADVLHNRLATLKGAPRWLETPEGFHGKLRPYQHEGLAWLHFLARTGIGGILADDMGLGKTVQVLAHLVDEKRRGGLTNPVLVVAPTSLIGNWRDEAARFVPELTLLILHGNNRRKLYAQIPRHDLVVTTYPLLPRDHSLIVEQGFSLLVLDEAQAIKNSRSQAARVVRNIKAQRRLAMTGTPLENHLGELWSQFDAVEPGLLGNAHQFTRIYRTPIEKQDDKAQRERLKKRIAPLLLR
ncbi:MAG: SNF2-related protein, partial [Gammaproteobacteria bacterium]|nr:SNF2-related protein [Gammaproteobacteria bacterium]